LAFCLVDPNDPKSLFDDEFFKKYEDFEKESVEDFIKRYSSTEKELRETIAYLIRHKEMMRDVEIKKLESEAQSLLQGICGVYDSTISLIGH